MVAERRENLSVDDWLSGANSTEEAQRKLSEACCILAAAGMSLSKWTSKNKYLMESFSNNAYVHDEGVRILGLQWRVL